MMKEHLKNRKYVKGPLCKSCSNKFDCEDCDGTDFYIPTKEVTRCTTQKQQQDPIKRRP